VKVVSGCRRGSVSPNFFETATAGRKAHKLNLEIAVSTTLPKPQNTATALDGVVAEARKLTPSFAGTAPLLEINVTTVAGGCVGAGTPSTAVGGTPSQLTNATAAPGRLATWETPCRLDMLE